MDIKPADIEKIDVLGELNDENVKIIKTFGGYFLAVGNKKKGQKSPEVLAAGSHPALVSHQLCKEFESFKPALQKSEHTNTIVEEVTSKLDPTIVNKGFEAFILSENNKINFIVSRFNLDIVKYEAEISNNCLSFSKHSSNDIAKNYPELQKNLASIMNDKCTELNINKLDLIKGK
ncbi:MAG TPA: hypothetical protein VI911_11935 [Patescibacteria group bacterium]|nr:hypothetical protein [Patescibacteria group bacterium]